MKIRTIAIFAAAVFAGAIGGSLVGPRPAEAVAREIIDLQRDVTTLLQGQKDMSDQTLKDHTVLKTLVEQASDNVGKLNSTMSSVQKSVQDVQANSGARLDTMSTQVQGLSDNLEEIKSRLGKLNQQLVDLQGAVQSIDAKISGSAPATAPTGSAPTRPGNDGNSAPPSNSVPTSSNASPAPSADMLYSNGLRDITSGKYDLARQEFQDYLKFYGDTDLASNAQFYLGEIAYSQKQYQQAVDEYQKVLTVYPKSFKLEPAHLKKGMALIELGQKNAGIKELREVIRRYPGTEEERRARARLKELGVSVTASAAN
ncbi:MAG TPA: tol-pal system protein YbgF [Candidatus Acidoferrum sp.]|jgi:tol-pal system protein YbgF